MAELVWQGRPKMPWADMASSGSEESSSEDAPGPKDHCGEGEGRVGGSSIVVAEGDDQQPRTQPPSPPFFTGFKMAPPRTCRGNLSWADKVLKNMSEGEDQKQRPQRVGEPWEQGPPRWEPAEAGGREPARFTNQQRRAPQQPPPPPTPVLVAKQGGGKGAALGPRRGPYAQQAGLETQQAQPARALSLLQWGLHRGNNSPRGGSPRARRQARG